HLCAVSRSDQRLPHQVCARRYPQSRPLSRRALAITAGIGSDHVDLEAASQHGITVAEVTYSNSISVAEHAVMQILALVRNYIPSYQWVIRQGWVNDPTRSIVPART